MLAWAKQARGRVYAVRKREIQRDLVYQILAQSPGAFPKANVSIRIVESDRRRDPDNVIAGTMKFVFDSLVTAGVVPDDRGKHLGKITIHPIEYADENAVHLTITVCTDS